MAQQRLLLRLTAGSQLVVLNPIISPSWFQDWRPLCCENTCTPGVLYVSWPRSSSTLPSVAVLKETTFSEVLLFPLEAPRNPPTLSAGLFPSSSSRSHARNRPWRSSWPSACRTRRPRWPLSRGPCRRRRLCLKSESSCWPSRRPWRSKVSSWPRRQPISGTWGPTGKCSCGLDLQEPQCSVDGHAVNVGQGKCVYMAERL